MLADLRGWGHIVGMKEFAGNQILANQFQDMVGEFIAAAINEKTQREL